MLPTVVLILFHIAQMYLLKCESSICSLRVHDKGYDKFLSWPYKTACTVEVGWLPAVNSDGWPQSRRSTFLCVAPNESHKTLIQEPPTKSRQVNRSAVIRTDKTDRKINMQKTIQRNRQVNKTMFM
jgi:hypothetical protein